MPVSTVTRIAYARGFKVNLAPWCDRLADYCVDKRKSSMERVAGGATEWVHAERPKWLLSVEDYSI